MRIVIKIGTSTITDGNPHVSRPRPVDLVRQMSEISKQGHDVILVSSGAIAVGRETLNFPNLPKSILAKQMLSAVGQPRFMALWSSLFDIYHKKAAQVLVTHGDLASRRRYLNARNTLEAIIRQGVIPIVNENDIVATEEIRVGDNDNLSALVANLINADYLILLKDQDGLYSADPRTNADAILIEVVKTSYIRPDLWDAAGCSGALGVGGMRTKLEAADRARRSGVTVFIARASKADILHTLFNGKLSGTKFLPTNTAIESFKRFILSGWDAGALTIDSGAAQALRQACSLLPPCRPGSAASLKGGVRSA